MTFWLAIRRLLPLLAILGIALAPVTASAATAGMRASTSVEGHPMAMLDDAMGDMAGMAMDDMPCCPKDLPDLPDCSKACPLMALCLAKVATGFPGGLRMPARLAVLEGKAWSVTAAFDSLSQRPPSEPPRA
ncbi:hypothetical protein ASF41_13205 [Methylobacterium sp. Leaf111]|uniref:hypothetical protein n=1 Tax=Methylobacterium sp. Leaf111 TaxID=1736257 RepID=UPI00070095F9|nr:hypothetical protein [Methylobacterium sp. Leaf111]KQP51138.1 hypothetical protein ASF41_13205 [Methylobacterium sp. Leaf111]